MGPLKTSRDVFLDAEGLVKEEGDGALLGVQSVFQLASLGVWNHGKKIMTPGIGNNTRGVTGMSCRSQNQNLPRHLTSILSPL